MLKIRVGTGDSIDSINTIEKSEDGEEHNAVNNDSMEARRASGSERQLDMKKEVESQVDKLDSLLAKAENAQYSMQYQNKQMKKLL